MPLLRPTISLETRCRVALRQLGELWPDAVIEQWRVDRTVAPAYRAKGFGKLLDSLLDRLAPLLGCDRAELRLDHDPALENREKVFDTDGKHIEYKPAACDPEHLIYRTKHGHHLKTNVRGDGAQFADNVIAKRERRRKKKLMLKAAAGNPISALKASTSKPRKFQWPKGQKMKSRNTFRRKS